MTLNDFLNYRAPRWADFPDIELYMDQVIGILEKKLAPLYWEEQKIITSTMINNYVKQKILPPPENKRYSRAQIARIFTVCVLKRFMQLSEIARLLQNLEAGRDAEAVYTLFAENLESAIHFVFGGAPHPAEVPTDLNIKTVWSACIAFATISYSRLIYLNAAQTWPCPTEDKEKDKDKKKEKKAETKEKKRT